MTFIEKDKYKFWAKVSDDKNNIVKDVVCEIITPLKNIDKIEVTLKPISKEQYEKITSFSKCRIHGFVQHRDGTIQNEIKINDSYIIKSLYTDWGVRLGEYSINIHPFSLEIITPISSRNNEKIIGGFWISPNSFLIPHKNRTLSYTGEVNVRIGRQIVIKLSNEIILKFDTNYKYSSKNNLEKSFSESVASFETNNLNYNINETLSYVDNLMFLTSFAERRKIVCIGWNMIDEKSHTEFYRRNISIKELVDYEDNYNDNSLIDIINFEEYLNHVIKKYKQFRYKNLLKHAIQVISHKYTNIIEENFLSTFTAIETLFIFAFSENKLSNEILPKDRWNQLKKEIEITIHNSSSFEGFENQKVTRRLVSSKLKELNRLSFSECIKSFCGQYNLQVDDLWPLIGGQYISLKNIRDQLVHGVKMEDEKFSALWCAENHLRWTAERMVLAILDWDLEKTNISHGGMGHIYPYRDLKIHQQNLNDWKR
ncbi:MAG: hypothetical protein GWP19_14055 [Planctomycetia bacterium]|nr:hypothetical protein [Planctomycetia bacterium]